MYASLTLILYHVYPHYTSLSYTSRVSSLHCHLIHVTCLLTTLFSLSYTRHVSSHGTSLSYPILRHRPIDLDMHFLFILLVDTALCFVFPWLFFFFFLPPCFFQSPGLLDRVTPVRVLAVILSQARVGVGLGGGGVKAMNSDPSFYGIQKVLSLIHI